MIEDYLKEFSSKKRYRSIYKPKTVKIESGDSVSFSAWRFILPYILVITIFSIIIYNLVVLQILEGDQNDFLASANYKKEQIVKAPRGLIYDSKGNPLVYNIPSFRVMLDNEIIMSRYIPGEIGALEKIEDEFLEQISSILSRDKEVLKEIYLNGSRNSKGEPILNHNITLLKDLDKEEVLGLYSSIGSMEGIYVYIDEYRQYEYPQILAHVLGYTGEVTDTDLQRDPALSYIDDIGKSGVELSYDKILRGTNGVNIAEQDIAKEGVSEYTSEYVIRGSDLFLYIDVEMQKKLYEILEKNLKDADNISASAAIMEVETGGLVAVASLPTYNPNLLSEKIGEYLKNDRNVFLDRFISAYPPGSTFKTFIASTLLEEGVINEDTSFSDQGVMDLGGGFKFVNFRSRSLGNIKVKDALALSSNLFFCNYSKGVGNNTFDKYAYNFRIGEYTNIDIPAENKGSFGNAITKKGITGEGWYPGDNCNLAIGQGYTKVTPVQMISWINAIANDGKYIEPRFVDAYVDSETSMTTRVKGDTTDLGISQENLEIVQKGMRQGVNSGANGIGGTGGYLNSPDISVASKTGTAEATVKINGIWEANTLGWATGYMPYEEPKYSFVIFIEGGDANGTLSTKIMREYIDWLVDYGAFK